MHVDCDGIVRQGRLERRRGLDPDARRHHLDRGCAEQSQLGAIHPFLQEWVSDGSTIANLQGPPEVGCIPYGGGNYCPPGEIGPAILRPDRHGVRHGRTHLGASAGHTAVYHPGPAPPILAPGLPRPRTSPNGDDAGDNFAVLLISGSVLVEGNSGRFYEFDGTNFTPTLCSNGGSLLVLPTGEVLVGGSQVYTTHRQLPPVVATRSSLSFPSSVRAAKATLFSGTAVQWPVAGGCLWRRIRNRDQLSPGADHQQCHRARFLRQDSQPQQYGCG